MSAPRPTRSASWPRGWSRPACPGTRRRRRSPSPAPRTPGRRRCGSDAGSRTRAHPPRSARSRSAATPPPRSRSPTGCAGRCRSPEASVPGAHAGRLRRPRRRARSGRRAPMPAGRRRPARARPGSAGTVNRSARITASATTPTRSVAQWMSPSVRSPRSELPPGAVAVGGRSGQLRQLADRRRRPPRRRGSRSRPPWRGTGRSSPASRAASSRNRTPVSSVIAATSCAAWSPPSPVTSTAPPATAASEELGPVEICRDVQNTA